MVSQISDTVHIIVNWTSGENITKNSISEHTKILKNGSKYVWYGKMVKTNPPKEIPEEFLQKIMHQIKNKIDTHLYLFDPELNKNICHVAKIESIQIGTALKGGKTPKELELIPPHYNSVRYDVSYWFKLSDFKLLTLDVLEHLFDIDNEFWFNNTHTRRYPVLIKERATLKPVFDYSLTHGEKWFEVDNLYLKELYQITDQNSVFVIMPISPEFKNTYEIGIKATITNLRLKLKCDRVDESLVHKAIIKIVKQKIEKADFIIADITGHNPNVAYELGYAHALHKTTFILTQGEYDKLPFDFQKFYVIKYDPKNLTQLKNDLAAKIKEHMKTKTK